MDLRRWGPIVVCAVSLASSGCVSPVRGGDADPVQAALNRRALAAELVSNWHDTSALAAKRLLQEYGPPDEVHYGRLVWNDNKPWKRTVVRDVTPPYEGGDDLGVIEQTVEFPLSPAQSVSVAAFDARLSYDARQGELSSRSDREELNYLRMNIADDVANGREAPDRARQTYAGIVSLEQSGKSSPYMAGLRFLPGAP
jgi:hypothetical protein